MAQQAHAIVSAETKSKVSPVLFTAAKPWLVVDAEEFRGYSTTISAAGIDSSILLLSQWPNVNRGDIGGKDSRKPEIHEASRTFLEQTLSDPLFVQISGTEQEFTHTLADIQLRLSHLRSNSSMGDHSTLGSAFGSSNLSSNFVPTLQPKLDFPRFDGTEPRIWISKCRNYFRFMPKLSNVQKIHIATIHFEGKALMLSQSLNLVDSGITWEQFVEVVFTRFEDWKVRNIILEFNKLHQDGTYAEYVERFQELKACLSLYDDGKYYEEYYLANFLSGLSEKLGTLIQMFQPERLHEAIELGQKLLIVLEAMSTNWQPPKEVESNEAEEIFEAQKAIESGIPMFKINMVEHVAKVQPFIHFMFDDDELTTVKVASIVENLWTIPLETECSLSFLHEAITYRFGCVLRGGEALQVRDWFTFCIPIKWDYFNMIFTTFLNGKKVKLKLLAKGVDRVVGPLLTSNPDWWGDVSGALLPHPRISMILGGIERHFDGVEKYESGKSEFAGNSAQNMVVLPTKNNQSTGKSVFKILICGRTSWIGRLFGTLYEKQGIQYEYGKGHLENRAQISVDIVYVKPTHVLNAVGLTGIPHVDWYESHKTEIIRVNVVGNYLLLRRLLVWSPKPLEFLKMFLRFRRLNCVWRVLPKIYPGTFYQSSVAGKNVLTAGIGVVASSCDVNSVAKKTCELGFWVKPLGSGLKVGNDYVRMVASVGVLILYHLSVSTCLNADFPHLLKHLMLKDEDDQVIAKCSQNMLGYMQDSPYILEGLVENWDEEDSAEVRLNFPTAVMKCFLKRAPETQKSLREALVVGVTDFHQDVHDRALLYYPRGRGSSSGGGIVMAHVRVNYGGDSVKKGSTLVGVGVAEDDFIEEEGKETGLQIELHYWAIKIIMLGLFNVLVILIALYSYFLYKKLS